MRYLSLLALAGAYLTSGAVFASSDEAWAQGEQELTTACIKASGLRNAKPFGNIILFDDEVGYSALFITGNYPQKQMKNQRGRELCLYQRNRKKAFVAEANMLPTDSTHAASGSAGSFHHHRG